MLRTTITHLQIFTLLFTLTLSPPTTAASSSSHTRGNPTGVGINCQGSSQCSFTTVNSPNLLAQFNSTLLTGTGTTPNALPSLPGGPISDLELFFKDEHIICARNLRWLAGSVCVFLQGKEVPATGVPGFVIKRLVNHLSYHGCKFCGSVPISEDNRPFRLGVLTSNYVVNKGCHGVCEQPRRKMYLRFLEDWVGVGMEGK
ncbi:MAG: hypothetical protein L6R40_004098 [Gallowayella cf. fulva]|nr:MAG: hypothetical protein L6R40_004098 [Xanthomendoza cf. fulva]